LAHHGGVESGNNGGDTPLEVTASRSDFVVEDMTETVPFAELINEVDCSVPEMTSALDNKWDKVPVQLSRIKDFTPRSDLGFFSASSGCTHFVATLIDSSELEAVVDD